MLLENTTSSWGCLKQISNLCCSSFQTAKELLNWDQHGRCQFSRIQLLNFQGLPRNTNLHALFCSLDESQRQGNSIIHSKENVETEMKRLQNETVSQHQSLDQNWSLPTWSPLLRAENKWRNHLSESTGCSVILKESDWGIILRWIKYSWDWRQ